jgi:fumarate hydratase subunit beta
MPTCLTLPLDRTALKSLRAGDEVWLSGVLYTGRDAAHKRMMGCLDAGHPLPVDLNGQVIYYVGPCPAPPGRPIGSAGPTTSGRMDAYAPRLLDMGLAGMIGKGLRDEGVRAAVIRNGAVYFGAIGGAAALLADRVEASEVVAFADLGTEAIHRLVVRDFPVFVVMDTDGNDLYDTGRAEAARALEQESRSLDCPGGVSGCGRALP